MKPDTSHPAPRTDAESTMQERFNPVAWLVFHLVALWTTVAHWLRFKRICSWHEPKPCYMGGNPFARRVTHGMCPACAVKFECEVVDRDPKHLIPAIKRNLNWNHEKTH